MIEAALNEQSLRRIIVDMSTSEEEGDLKGILSIFKDINYLGCERSSKKEAFKYLWKV